MLINLSFFLSLRPLIPVLHRYTHLIITFPDFSSKSHYFSTNKGLASSMEEIIQDDSLNIDNKIYEVKSSSSSLVLLIFFPISRSLLALRTMALFNSPRLRPHASMITPPTTSKTFGKLPPAGLLAMAVLLFCAESGSALRSCKSSGFTLVLIWAM